MARSLSTPAAADALRGAADAIAIASAALDRVCNHASRELVSRVEAIPGQDSVERALADHLNALADALDAEVEAELEGI